jgi:precorrin-6Y C5,15-methyltransferase (decarboxylating)
MLRFVVIGITDHPNPWFPPEVMELIQRGRVFSGGKRHHEIVAPLLPVDAQWIDITVPLKSVFEQYTKSPLCSEGDRGRLFIIFASGDPLFFGFANTLRREFPDADIQVFPTFNSLQMLAHRLVMPYHDMRIVSLTGRPWPEFDRALIERSAKIGVLTDKEHTPAAIAQRMLEYGYTDYTMHVGEHLGHPSKEKVSTLTLEEAAQHDFSNPNCVILNSCNSCRSSSARLLPKGRKNSWFGIPDSSFALLDGREKMITKMPIRLLTLQALDLPTRHVLWDIGFCTGSVSIEARLLFPHLQIEAFEIRPECEAIIRENMRRFGAPGIHIHIGDFLSTPLLTTPDAVFIGGHGGHLKEIMAKVLTVLAPGGIIVFNSVTSPKVPSNSRQLWEEACRELGLQQKAPLHIQLNDYNPIDILAAIKPE